MGIGIYVGGGPLSVGTNTISSINAGILSFNASALIHDNDMRDDVSRPCVTDGAGDVHSRWRGNRPAAGCPDGMR
jgi:hypothetical protein